MPRRRAATVTQADIARTIRAVVAEDLKVVRVVIRADGVSIETTETETLPPAEKPDPEIVL